MANVDKLKAYKGEVPTCWKRAIAFQPAVVMPAACDERNGSVGQIYRAAGLSDTTFVPAGRYRPSYGRWQPLRPLSCVLTEYR